MNGSMRQHKTPRKLGPIVTRLTTPVCNRMGFAQAAILLDWPDIVGKQFANLCDIEKVSFPYKKRTDGRVHVRTSSAMAMELSYLEPLILEKINRYFGYQAVTKLTIHQGARKKREVKVQKAPSQPTQSVIQYVSKCVESVDDLALRDRLRNLGEQMCQYSRS
jgi:hypothetical protein